MSIDSGQTPVGLNSLYICHCTWCTFISLYRHNEARQIVTSTYKVDYFAALPYNMKFGRYRYVLVQYLDGQSNKQPFMVRKNSHKKGKGNSQCRDCGDEIL